MMLYKKESHVKIMGAYNLYTLVTVKRFLSLAFPDVALSSSVSPQFGVISVTAKMAKIIYRGAKSRIPPK